MKSTDGRVEGVNTYVVGWAKRGPSGVIGTNKSDSTEVMKLLVEDLDSPKVGQGIEQLLSKRGVMHVSQELWERINSAEISAGEQLGKPRVKFVKREEMLGLK